jgi:formyltetrahydrofolate synthetase
MKEAVDGKSSKEKSKVVETKRKRTKENTRGKLALLHIKTPFPFPGGITVLTVDLTQ